MLSAVPTWQWIAVLGCLFASAFFSGAETALTALGEARVSALIERGGRASLLTVWQRHPERVLTALLLGNTLVNIAVGSLTTLIAVQLGVDHGALLGTAASTLVVLVFCEVAPKTLAKRYSTGAALALMPLVALLYWVLWPLVALIALVPPLIVKVIGLPTEPKDPVTSHELEFLIEQGARQGSLDRVRQELLSSVLAFTETLVKEIMVPRTRVVALEQGATAEEAIKLATESELSRIPVYRETLDEVTGILYVKLMLPDLRPGAPPRTFQLARYVRSPYFVPEVMKVSRLLQEMQKRKTHLAVVVDEFGGTSGIVTLEDVVEQIVGDIHDESDVEEKRIKVLSDGVVIADAQVTMRDLEEHLGVDFPDDRDYETLGGFLTSTAGRVPPTGSLVLWGDLTFTVRAGDERRVLKVEISRKRAERHEKAASQPPAAREAKEAPGPPAPASPGKVH